MIFLSSILRDFLVLSPRKKKKRQNDSVNKVSSLDHSMVFLSSMIYKLTVKTQLDIAYYNKSAPNEVT